MEFISCDKLLDPACLAALVSQEGMCLASSTHAQRSHFPTCTAIPTRNPATFSKASKQLMGKRIEFQYAVQKPYSRSTKPQHPTSAPPNSQLETPSLTVSTSWHCYEDYHHSCSNSNSSSHHCHYHCLFATVADLSCPCHHCHHDRCSCQERLRWGILAAPRQVERNPSDAWLGLFEGCSGLSLGFSLLVIRLPALRMKCV